MKKGLNVTLMTVAVVMLAVQAMATAPVISEIPSPIVGNEPGATGATPFVFPDAIDLNNYVTDETPDAQIRWSYAVEGSQIYSINNVAPIVVGTDNIVRPDQITPTSKQINNQVIGSELNPDGLANTITIRNINLAPLGGSVTVPGTTGIQASQVVTFFASDGELTSQTEVMFYTDVGGIDRLSGVAPGGVQVYKMVNRTGWTYEFIAGGVTSGTSGTQGICLEVALTGINFAGWNNTYGMIPLVQNAVYHIRARVNGSNSTAGTVPFWDLVIHNYDMGQNPAKGENLYGMDTMCLDNENGANAALNRPTTDGTDYHVWWTPAAVKTAAWNNASTGVFSSTYAGSKDGTMKFRVLDVNNNGGITADNDYGTLCLTDVEITRFDLDSMQMVAANLYDNHDLTASNLTVIPFINATVDFSGGANGVCTVKENTSANPDQDGTRVEYLKIYSGPNIENPNYGNPDSFLPSYPVPWDSDSLYQLTIDLSAPSDNDANHSYDVFWLSMDSPTNEIIMESFVTAGAGRCAMPKSGDAQTYMAFYWSAKQTLSNVTQFRRLRPRLNVGNNMGLVWGDVGGVASNTGAMTIHNMKVHKVRFE